MSKGYRDRSEAGRLLARQLARYAARDDVVVMGLPRGGIPVAAEVAQYLDAPLELLIVRKVGLPGQEELAIGAVATGDVFVPDETIIAAAGITDTVLARLVASKFAELKAMEQRLIGSKKPRPIKGKVAIVVDDGVATGSTIRAAVAALRQRGPERVVIAVPVGPVDSLNALGEVADEVVCPERPPHFRALSLWYRRFDQVSEETVRQIIHEAHQQELRE